jgi:hypothetical protein
MVKQSEALIEFPASIPADVVEKALTIQAIYTSQHYGTDDTPIAWETVGQSIAKLRVVAREPYLIKKPDSRLAKHIAIIQAFDLQAGSFPPEFDLATGLYNNVE